MCQMTPDMPALPVSPSLKWKGVQKLPELGTVKYILKLSERRSDAVVEAPCGPWPIAECRRGRHEYGTTNFVATKLRVLANDLLVGACNEQRAVATPQSFRPVFSAPTAVLGVSAYRPDKNSIYFTLA